MADTGMAGGAGRSIAWFIYYKVATDDLLQVLTEVRRFQAGLRADDTALLTRVLRRPAAMDGLCTLMETYAWLACADATASAHADHGGLADDLSAGTDPVLPAAIANAAVGLTPWLRSPRHVEVFIPCA